MVQATNPPYQRGDLNSAPPHHLPCIGSPKRSTEEERWDASLNAYIGTSYNIKMKPLGTSMEIYSTFFTTTNYQVVIYIKVRH
jgi:hypothetical protein